MQMNLHIISKHEKHLSRNIITKQADGLLHSNFTKLLEDGTSNISKSTYSTCDADTPHFYINLPKAKVYPGRKNYFRTREPCT